MRAFLFSIPLVIIAGGPALAQPANDRLAERGIVLPPQPAPDLPEGSKPSDYLRAAEAAVATGHNAAADSALEMAETRLLDRSVPLFQTNTPSENPISLQISKARQALAAHDRTGCIQLIESAISAATAQGL